MQSHRIELYGNIIDLPAPRVFANSIYRIFNPIENNWHNRIIDNFYNIFKNLDDVYENSEKIAQEVLSESVSAALGILAENSIYDVDEKNFIEPNFNGWVLANRLKTGTVDIIDETRNLDSISDFDKAVEAANRIKGIVDREVY